MLLKITVPALPDEPICKPALYVATPASETMPPMVKVLPVAWLMILTDGILVVVILVRYTGALIVDAVVALLLVSVAAVVVDEA